MRGGGAAGGEGGAREAAGPRLVTCTDEPSTLKNDLSNASSDRWKTAPIFVSTASFTSRTSRSAGIALPTPRWTGGAACADGGGASAFDARRAFLPMPKTFSFLFWDGPDAAAVARRATRNLCSGRFLTTSTNFL